MATPCISKSVRTRWIYCTRPMGSGGFGGCVIIGGICIRSIPHSYEIYNVNCDCVSHV